MQTSDAKRREKANAHPLFESDVGWVSLRSTHPTELLFDN